MSPGPTAGGALSAPYSALVVTASNRAAAGVYEDRGGPLLVEGLNGLGFAVDGPEVVPDGDPVEAALREGVAAGYDVIVTTGGTGISPTDRTPEATRRVVDTEVPGIAEAIRAYGREKVPTSALSRGLAGVAGGTLVVNLPGSTGGVKDGLAVLGPLLVHAVDQLRGGDHTGGPTGGGQNGGGHGGGHGAGGHGADGDAGADRTDEDGTGGDRTDKDRTGGDRPGPGAASRGAS